ncbi:MAG: Fe(3+) ABC transporter substrate-binding protein [Acholeplasmataceae bacterium]
MSKKYILLMTLGCLAIFLSACQFGQTKGDNVVTIYSERHYDVDQELYDAFTESTGIQVQVVRDGADQLMTRLENEGTDSPADLLIIADVGRIHQAKEQGLLQTSTSEILDANIPSKYRDSEDYWYGLTKRARVLVYHPDRVDVSDLSTYEALTEEVWQGRVITRTSTNIYNQSLMASFIAIHGREAAQEWAAGLVANFARDPQGNDRDQAKAVVAGDADVAIMNTYYIGRMLYSSDPFEVEVAQTVRVFFPNQETTGTHVNISAGGITKYAPNKENALRLLEFLSQPEQQAIYAEANFEYPIHPDVEPHALLKSWGDFIAQDIPLYVLGQHSTEATIVMNEVGWK